MTVQRRFLVDGQNLTADECLQLFANDPISHRQAAVLDLAEGDAIVDIGCYAGGFVAALKERWPDKTTIGVDYVDDHIAISKLRFPQHADCFRQMSVYELDFPDASLDCVTLQEVLEHLEGAAQAVKEINRALKPGGALIVSVPNPFFWRQALAFAIFEFRNRLRRIVGRPPRLYPQIYFDSVEWNRHIYAWTPDTLLTLMMVNGFDYVRHEYERGSKLLDRTILSVFPFLGATLILKVRKQTAADARLV